jgi:hypothetical protein
VKRRSTVPGYSNPETALEKNEEQEGSDMPPPISEAQLVAISVILLLCGGCVGFIVGSLWMEQRLKRRYAERVEELAQKKLSDRVSLSL